MCVYLLHYKHNQGVRRRKIIINSLLSQVKNYKKLALTQYNLI